MACPVPVRVRAFDLKTNHMAHEKTAIEKGYSVTPDGVVINKKGVRVSARVGSRGYRSFTLRIGAKTVQVFTHRLQAYQLFGDGINASGIQVRHLNGVPTDNRRANISIGTASENNMDKPQSVRLLNAQNAASYVKKHDPFRIKEFHRESKSYKATMEAFGITSKGTLFYILNH